MGLSVLYDDRDEGPGSKLADIDLIGIPMQIRVGPKSLSNNSVELKKRNNSKVDLLSVEQLIIKMEENYKI